MGTPHGFFEAGVHGQIGDGLSEDHIRAGGDIGGTALERGRQSFSGQGVRASHDDEVRVGPGIDGGLDAIDHLLRRNQFLAGPVAAAFAAYLVFDVHGGSPGALHGADGAGDVEGASPAGVDIDQQRQVGDLGDAAHVDQHIFHGADAEVGHAERVGGHSTAGEVERAKAGGLRHARGERVDGADHLQWMLLLNGGAEAFSGHVVPFSN